MTPQQTEKRRKVFFIGISLLATAITLASASATYTINMRSFADWKTLGSILAVLATAGVEATFALTLFGVAYALVGWVEKGLAAALLFGTIFAMATNYTVHHKVITHAPLTDWQIDYIQWAGPLSIFGILLLIVGIVVFNHDARERRLEREISFAARRKALEWEQEQLQSDALEAHMAQYQPQVFEKVRRALTLPSQFTGTPRRAIGMAPVNDDERGEHDPKAGSDQD
jgi:hypothetical protein